MLFSSSLRFRRWRLLAGLPGRMLSRGGQGGLACPDGGGDAVLLVDAWFDVCTAPAGGPLVLALADMCVEVVEAVGCLALAVAVWRTSALAQGGAR